MPGTMKPLWKQILSRSIVRPEGLSECFGIDGAQLGKVTARYPMRINPYYLSLIKHVGDPIYRQCVPDIREIQDGNGTDDPLNEEGLAPTPGLTHRYPDRVLLLVSSRCAVYCRFCNRKRKVGRPEMVSRHTIREGLRYIRGNKKIRDVLLSGGDPFLLNNRELEEILADLRSIRHVEIIRIGTRVPCTLPQRVTPRLASLLRRFHPLYIHTHFNHPDEITSEAALACGRLADAGLPLACQTVLLRGINDDVHVMRLLMQKLLTIRVRPYYLFQGDLVKGTSHFWTPLSKGSDIIAGLQGHTTGLCVPNFVVDLPGGSGKVPVNPFQIEFPEDRIKGHVVLRNYLGKKCFYPIYEP